MRSKRILFFCSFPPPLTGQRIATKLIFDLLNNYASAEFLNLSTKQGTIGKVGFVRIVFAYIKKYIFLIKKLKKQEYDYVYTAFAPSKAALFKDYLSACIIKTFSKGKLIAHLHCGNYGENYNGVLFSAVFNKLISKVDTFIFLSPVLKKTDAISNAKTFFLNNTISSDVVCTDIEIKNKIAAKQLRDHLSLYYISNMIKEKGYNDLVDAAAILKQKSGFCFKLHLIGSWPGKEDERIRFENKLKANDLDKCIIVYGGVDDREQIKNYLLDADVFILPTYYPIEAQPLSIIEAFNAATPVISTLHASIPDMVDDGENGYLVNTHSPEEIADRVLLYQSYSRWKAHAYKAREKYNAGYEKTIFIKNLKCLFNL